ncbi:hypothetical protein ANANG_G00128960 [Anguilla anguilla]|uniref:Uncharacterized protein n=1 Tax=Anguilla anguilla TaxID=7936 RepID=A0A9D3MEV6_ANGAN|nr:hypothetical protein ANANG_G00128960 [Anguilla anguilla]
MQSTLKGRAPIGNASPLRAVAIASARALEPESSPDIRGQKIFQAPDRRLMNYARGLKIHGALRGVAMAADIGSPPRFFHMPRFQHQAPRQLFYKRPDFAQQQAMQQLTFDGKRMRKAVNRKTIDYNPSVISYLENRLWQRDHRDFARSHSALFLLLLQ